MGRARYIACALLMLCPLALTRHDDDFAFDNSEEFLVELTANHSEIAKNGLRRLWGVPDTSAYVGHLFRMEIPKEAFSGKVLAYKTQKSNRLAVRKGVKVRSEGGRRMPSWLAVDSRHGLISGVPQKQDLGTHTFTVTAHGSTRGLTATDSFTVEVKKAQDRPHSKYGSCVGEESRLVLVIMLDGSFHRVSPRQRTRALMQLASFMALDGDEFWMEPYKAEPHAETIMSGAGSSQRRHGDATTAIYLNVGCGNKLWNHHKVLVAGIREQARDGTLAHVVRLPVIGWRLLAVQPAPRIKRQLEGSGGNSYDAEYDNEDDDADADADYSGYDDGIDDEDGFANHDVGTDVHNEVGITALSASPSDNNSVNMSVPPTLPVSPRRMGVDSFAPVILQEETTTLEPELQTVIIRESTELHELSSSTELVTSPSPSPQPEAPTTPPPPPTTSPTPTTVPTTASTTTSTTTTTQVPTTSRTTTLMAPLPPTMTTPESILDELTHQEPNPTEGKSTISGVTTETVTWALPINQPPTLKHHMKKLAITAGKAFRYIIPADLFTDPEEGSNLTFTMYEAENVPLSNNSWIQFIPAAREVYGLPLEAHVSRWNFIVEAQDSEGLVARGPLDITVQQHKSGRTINHQFVMEFKLIKEYNNAIDWQIRALEGIVNLFRDTDMDHLTVLNTTQNGDMCEFVWTNDTLPKDPACPMDDIKRLMKIMESDTDPGGPSAGLVRAMQPELKAGGVSWRGRGPCAATPATRAPDTYPPVTRNQVDHLTATVGHLLVYKVPEDTFFDPEDGGTRNLALSLRYSDRTELPAGHWLQFDAKNQEFYGLPAPSDEGSVSYQLIAEDSSKKSAYDSLIVEVAKAPTIRPTVEFQMTMEYPFPMLAYDANNKRKVVEKLAALFGQKETDNIRIQSITNNPTTIIWYNTSLPMDRCPKKEIEELRKMIIVDERGSMGGALKENVDHVFDKDLKVMSIRLIPLGLCAEQNTKIPKTTIQVHPGSSSSQNNKASNAADPNYLVTFIIPAVVIVCMILLASIVACVLYRRRRTGKMSVGDEEERQAFRSKGIPVIFQDELEERGDAEPVHKSPVIMREEKPPLLPPAPDYRAHDDAPYRPPPPFAASRTPPRPKATPTYRKPPPYVPP
ncbi:dystroglycan 1 isoform X1 [Helicoverpa zea]|uniref:dystroglycan 1 isoform X1 n=1 Tax=Helicoverpa zea TaxID=7113 RepID=UPI001F5706B3|nr:dystroglycan 1 isoform X1 [Helicoverpa zea]XP_047030653.1 dystroglycan 1 isoform X1 [Helicoverpa zea]XP_047030654.1 dystroglycan 1 isoform X1 [Helicoverpa zea]